MANDIYTVGDGARTHIAMRADGVWFIRSKWRGLWGKWKEIGTKRPFETGMYLVPGIGKAKLPAIDVLTDGA